MTSAIEYKQAESNVDLATCCISFRTEGYRGSLSNSLIEEFLPDSSENQIFQLPIEWTNLNEGRSLSSPLVSQIPHGFRIITSSESCNIPQATAHFLCDYNQVKEVKLIVYQDDEEKVFELKPVQIDEDDNTVLFATRFAGEGLKEGLRYQIVTTSSENNGFWLEGARVLDPLAFVSGKISYRQEGDITIVTHPESYLTRANDLNELYEAPQQEVAPNAMSLKVSPRETAAINEGDKKLIITMFNESGTEEKIYSKPGSLLSLVSDYQLKLYKESGFQEIEMFPLQMSETSFGYDPQGFGFNTEFFSSTSLEDQIRELKLVKEILNKNGIRLIFDFVPGHFSNEGQHPVNELGANIYKRGDVDLTGAGNTVGLGLAPTTFIIEALRLLAPYCNGFRLDQGGVHGTDNNGNFNLSRQIKLMLAQMHRLGKTCVIEPTTKDPKCLSSHFPEDEFTSFIDFYCYYTSQALMGLDPEQLHDIRKMYHLIAGGDLSRRVGLVHDGARVFDLTDGLYEEAALLIASQLLYPCKTGLDFVNLFGLRYFHDDPFNVLDALRLNSNDPDHIANDEQGIYSLVSTIGQIRTKFFSDIFQAYAKHKEPMVHDWYDRWGYNLVYENGRPFAQNRQRRSDELINHNFGWGGIENKFIGCFYSPHVANSTKDPKSITGYYGNFKEDNGLTKVPFINKERPPVGLYVVRNFNRGGTDITLPDLPEGMHFQCILDSSHQLPSHTSGEVILQRNMKDNPLLQYKHYYAKCGVQIFRTVVE
jgi:hypothetical protein